MSARRDMPTAFERRYYGRLGGCRIEDVEWDSMEGQPFPVLLVRTPNGFRLRCAVLRDPEGNGPGHLEICGGEEADAA